MKVLIHLAKPASWLSLLLLVLSPVLHYSGNLSASVMNACLIAGTIAWFAFTSLWMKSE